MLLVVKKKVMTTKVQLCLNVTLAALEGVTIQVLLAVKTMIFVRVNQGDFTHINKIPSLFLP
jgi:hypothetical protein